VLISLTDVVANVLSHTKADVPGPFNGLVQELVKTLWYFKVVNLPGEMWQIAHKGLDTLTTCGGGQNSLVCITPPERETWNSPAFKKLLTLPELLIVDWERFLGGEQSNVVEYLRAHNVRAAEPQVCTARDLYDMLGLHYQHGQSPVPRNRQTQPSMDEVLQRVKLLMEDIMFGMDEGDIAIEHIMKLHKASACDVSNEFRRSAVTGRVSARVYRVFIPHTELEKSLQLLIETLQAMRAQHIHPLVRAYYAFSTLVYYIHAFTDGNGRTARYGAWAASSFSTLHTDAFFCVMCFLPFLLILHVCCCLVQMVVSQPLTPSNPNALPSGLWETSYACGMGTHRLLRRPIRF
jgi:hypothetical protein